MAVCLAPLPDAIDERVAAELMAVFAFLRKILLDRVLHRDARVIGAGQPERVVPLHPARAHDNIVQSDVERVTEMELTGDVGRRNYDREDRARTSRVGLEVAEVNPALKPVLLRDFRVESFA